MKFASRPPKEVDSIISHLWDRHLPAWRSVPEEKKEKDPVKDKALVDYLKKFSNATPLAPDQIDFRPHEAEIISIERRVRKKKGSWWQVPKDLPDED